MTFDFVIETPHNRKINRNNNKIIQRRATQAGARTRLGNKNEKPTDHSANTETTTLPTRHAKPAPVPSDNSLLANANLTTPYNSPFLARFGRHGQMLYLHDADTSLPLGCFTLPDPTLSVLQRQLLASLSRQPAMRDTNRLFKIVNLTQRQFLNHLPSHYGHLPFLDEAMECLIARLHDTLPLMQSGIPSPSNKPSPTALYGRALTSLRSALDHALAQDLTYIWFAIMLLTLFELLSFGDEPGWVWHAAGASRILHKLGPKNIQSDFHMSLLSSQCRIMVVETISMNKPCYLAEPDWQEAIHRTILDCDDFGDRSRTSIELWGLGTRIPNLFQSVSDYVHGLTTSGSSIIRGTLRQLSNDMGEWQQEWRDVLETTCRNALNEGSIRHQSFMLLLAFYMLSMITNRLRTAIEPTTARNLENKAIWACTSTFQLRKRFMSCKFRITDNGSFKAQVAHGTWQTAARWEEEIESADSDAPIRSEVFDEWCSQIGRMPKETTPSTDASSGSDTPSSTNPE